LAGGQSGRLPPPGEKSVAFNTSFTQELKAFLEKLLPIFLRPCGAPTDGGKNKRTKTL
jgi:hypothetical protein